MQLGAIVKGCIHDACMDGFPSGQRGQTVNLLQIASVVRIHLHPLRGPARKCGFLYLRDLDEKRANEILLGLVVTLQKLMK